MHDDEEGAVDRSTRTVSVAGDFAGIDAEVKLALVILMSGVPD